MRERSSLASPHGVRTIPISTIGNARSRAAAARGRAEFDDTRAAQFRPGVSAVLLACQQPLMATKPNDSPPEIDEFLDIWVLICFHSCVIYVRSSSDRGPRDRDLRDVQGSANGLALEGLQEERATR